MASTAPTEAPAPQKPTAPGYIPEIQGLRTIALLLVATFHVWLDRVSGGVDVFLLISAYLMTRSLTARAESGKRTNPVAHLVRKFARLMPAAIAVIALTLVVGIWLMPGSLWHGYAGDGVASAAYVMNFRLQDLSVDYFAANDAFTSPFQHFWSLSIQGQIFIIWALLHFIAEIASRITRLPVRAILGVGFGLVFVVSLTRSIWLTDFNQMFAYFDTPARLWEFAAGSLLAIVQPWVKLPNWLRWVFFATGVIGILSCGFVLPVAATFPGYVALWPVISAGLVILAADGQKPVGVGRLLASPVLSRIGGYTYALYLTHWPTLIFFNFVVGVVAPNWWQGTMVLVMSAALAVLIVHFVERPVANWVASESRRPTVDRTVWRERIRGLSWRPLIAIATSATLALGAAFGVTSLVDQIRDANNDLIRQADLSALGANADSFVDLGEPLQDPALVKDDWVSLGYECAEDDPYGNLLCYEIMPEDGSLPSHVVYNIGNSHSGQLGGAFLEVVERQPTFAMRTQLAGSCNYEFSNEDISPECIGMWASAASYIADAQPDLVVVYGTYWEMGGGDRPVQGILEWVSDMQSVSPGTAFVVVRDNPRLDRSPFDCSMETSYMNPECVGEFIRPDMEYLADQVREMGAIWVDLTDDICVETQCAPTRGGLFTYVDNNHISGTYARTLAQALSEQIHAELSWWPSEAFAGTRTDRTPGVSFEEFLNKDYVGE